MVQQRSGRLWSLEFAFGGNPVGRINKLGSSRRKTINLTFEVVNDVSVTVERILKEWVQMVSRAKKLLLILKGIKFRGRKEAKKVSQN